MTLTLKWDVIAVCAVFVFVGAVLLGAFYIHILRDVAPENDTFASGLILRHAAAMLGAWRGS